MAIMPAKEGIVMSRLLTAAQLAAELQVKPTTVENWTKLGLIPAIRPTQRVIRFDLEAVIAALKRKKSPGRR